MTLLEITQSILSDLNSDEVNSIGDTVESLQVANIIKNTYFSMMATRNWPHLRKSIELVGVGSLTRPTHMRLPDGTKELEFINYNKQKSGETRLRYDEMQYISPDSFLRRCNQLNSDNDNVLIVEDFSGVQLLIKTDKAPQYYTSFDDNYIIFDSYDSSEDSTLIADKVQAMAYVTPVWVMSDEAIPDIPAEAFPMLLNESQSVAAYRLNQSADQKAEQEAVRQDRWLSRKSRRINNQIDYPNYGRHSSK
jgi:hypothetical protein